MPPIALAKGLKPLNARAPDAPGCFALTWCFRISPAILATTNCSAGKFRNKRPNLAENRAMRDLVEQFRLSGSYFRSGSLTVASCTTAKKFLQELRRLAP